MRNNKCRNSSDPSLASHYVLCSGVMYVGMRNAHAQAAAVKHGHKDLTTAASTALGSEKLVHLKAVTTLESADDRETR